jgi:hypothetical protein
MLYELLVLAEQVVPESEFTAELLTIGVHNLCLLIDMAKLSKDKPMLALMVGLKNHIRMIDAYLVPRFALGFQVLIVLPHYSYDG